MTAAERPILFSAPMVRAILAGNKTQTRRVVKLNRHYQIEERDDGSLWPWMYDDDRASDSWLACPYGMPGDRLWVRETFCDDWKDLRGIQYRADGGLDGDMTDAGCTWRPSIFMPRAVSRITLEVTEVRVERLQDISHEDAIAEGVSEIEGAPLRSQRLTVPQHIYAHLWDSINGPNSWDANPWVWAINFKRLA